MSFMRVGPPSDENHSPIDPLTPLSAASHYRDSLGLSEGIPRNDSNANLSLFKSNSAANLTTLSLAEEFHAQVSEANQQPASPELTEKQRKQKQREEWWRKLIEEKYDTSTKSFFYFSVDHPVRNWAIRVVESYAFNQTLVFVNAICFCLSIFIWLLTPDGAEYESIFMDAFRIIITFMFSVIFSFEMGMKIFAQGALFSKTAFFRKDIFWNVADVFFVYTSFFCSAFEILFYGTSITSIIINAFLHPNRQMNMWDDIWASILNFRTQYHIFGPAFTRIYGLFKLFHFLLPFRSLTFIPQARILVDAVFSSFPFLINAILCFLVMVAVLGIIGGHLFRGATHRTCMNPNTGDIYDRQMFCSIKAPNFEPKLSIDFTKPWDEKLRQIINYGVSTTKRIFFSVEGMGLGGNSCPSGYVCMEQSVLQNPSFGFIGFDYGFQSLFTTYQMLMADGLSDLMYMTMDSTHFLSFIFFIILYFAGPFLMQHFFIVIITKLVAKSISLFERGLKHNALMRVFQVNRSLLSQFRAFCGIVYDKSVKLFVPYMFVKFQKWIKKFYIDNSLAVVIMFSFSFLNTITLCLYSYNANAQLLGVLQYLNYIFLSIFTMDVTFNIIGFGVKAYFSDFFNYLECLSVVLGFYQLFTALPAPAASAIRSFKLYKFLKMGKKFKTMNHFYDLVTSSLIYGAVVSGLFFVFLSVSSLISQQLFGNADPAARINTVEFRDNKYLFDNFVSAFIACFRIATSENWGVITYSHLNKAGYWAVIFFVGVLIIGKYVILSLFLAVMLYKFSSMLTEKSPFADDYIAVVSKTMYHWLYGTDPKKVAKKVEKPKDKNQLTSYKVIYNEYMQKKREAEKFSFKDLKKFLLDGLKVTSYKIRWVHVVRRFIKTYILHSIFADLILLVVIIFDIVKLTLENPSILPNSWYSHWLYLCDLGITTIFVAEATIKIISYGPSAYFTKMWDFVDFSVTAGSVLSLFASTSIRYKLIYVYDIVLDYLFDMPVYESHYNILTTLILLKYLRPIRLVRLIPPTKHMFDAFFNSLRWMFNAFLFVSIIWLVFAILGVNQFSGKFYSCNFMIDERYYFNNYAQQSRRAAPLQLAIANNITRAVSQQIYHPSVQVSSLSGSTVVPMMEYFESLEIKNYDECKAYGGKWKTYPYNFDNVVNAFLTLFKLSTTEGWIDTMSAAIDINDIKLSPIKNNNPLSSIYFILFFIVGSFFTYNLFSIVQIQNFVVLNRINKKMDMNKRALTWKEIIMAIVFKNDAPRKQLMKEFKENLKVNQEKEEGDAPGPSAEEKKNLLSDENIVQDRDGKIWRSLKKLLKQHCYETDINIELEANTRKSFYEFFTVTPDKLPRLILDSGLFDAFFSVIIICNLLLLVIEYYHSPEYLTNLIHGANITFAIFYAFEISFRILFFDFKTDSISMLVLEAIIVITSFMETIHFFIYEVFHYSTLFVDNKMLLFILTAVENYLDFEFYAMFYHSLRALRSLRIVQSNSFIGILYTTAKGSFINLLELFGIYAVIMFIYTTIGVAVFGKLSPGVFTRFQFPITKNFYIFHLDVALEVVKQIPQLLNQLERPRTLMVVATHTSFDNFWNSFLTIFRLTKGDKFNDLLKLFLTSDQVCSRKLGDCPPGTLFLIGYFLSFIFCFVIITNLVVAIILHHFSEFLDAWESFAQSKSDWERSMNFSPKEKLMSFLADFILSMKQQKVMLAHIQERSDQLIDKNASLIESFNGLMGELDEKWKKFSIETTKNVQFSTQMSLDGFELFLKEVNPFFRIISDSRITPLANFKEKFGEKFKITEEGNVDYQNVMFLLFEDKFKPKGKFNPAPTYAQLK